MVEEERARVAFVDDDDLPPGLDWCYVVLDDGRDRFFIKRSCVCPETLSEAWSTLGAGRRGTTAA